MNEKAYLRQPPNISKPTELPPPLPNSESGIVWIGPMQSTQAAIQLEMSNALSEMSVCIAKLSVVAQKCVDILDRISQHGEEETRQKQPKPQPEGEPQTQQTQH